MLILPLLLSFVDRVCARGGGLKLDSGEVTGVLKRVI